MCAVFFLWNIFVSPLISKKCINGGKINNLEGNASSLVPQIFRFPDDISL